MSIHAIPRTLSLLRSGIDSGLHPGAQVYVSLDGRPIVDDAIGIARPNVAMTRDSLTLWMSAGKPVTAIAVMQLVDRGLISLDMRIAEVLPPFGVSGKEAITLRHLLTHTAGFRGPLNNFTPGTWDEILQRVYALKQEPGWVPGEKAGYHIGSSWFVLGEIVQRLTGEPFLLEIQSLFRVGDVAFIGLDRDTHHSYLLSDRLALMYDTSKPEPTTDWPGNSEGASQLPRPGANARGPIRALGHLYESLMAGVVPEVGDRWSGPWVLPELLCRQMCSRQRVGMIDHTFKQTLDWGLGVMIDSKQYAGEHQYGFGPHASADSFGHSGNQSSCAFCDPKHRLIVAWTCNGMPGEAKHQARASAINQAIYEDLGLA